MFLVAFAALPTLNKSAAADAARLILSPVFTAPGAANAPPVAAVPKPIASSSTAIEAKIPKVYPDCNKVLLIRPIAPPLVELPTAIALSKSFAALTSLCEK